MKIYRFNILKIFLIGFLFLFHLSSCNQNIVEDKRPINLVIVYPDQMRGRAMGFLEHEPVQTPNLDSFASQGLVLTDAISNYPICSPTRASLMTGKYAHQNGVLSNCNTISAPFGYELQENARTWSNVLNDKGYSLGYIGKWHLDNPQEPYINCSNNDHEVKWNEWTTPTRRHGFDYWYAYGTYDQHTRPLYWTNDAEREAFHYVDQWGPEHEADKAIEYLNNEGGSFRDPDKPFALMVSMNPPHMPYALVPDKYKALYADVPLDSLTQSPNIPATGTRWGDYYRKNIKNYYAMITGVDEQFGRILNTLKESGLDENTVVLFASDHGNCLGMHDMVSKNNHYEESVRIPFIVRWPGKIPARADNLLISTPDIYPTLLGLLGFDKDIPKDVSGVDFSSLFLTGEGERPSSQLYMSVPPGKPDMGRRGVRTLRYTLMINRDEANEVELYDNQEDPHQLNNLGDSRPDLVAELSKELKIWLDKTNDPWLLDTEPQQ
jgi:arylsulfatase A-like enzyme